MEHWRDDFPEMAPDEGSSLFTAECITRQKNPYLSIQAIFHQF